MNAHEELAEFRVRVPGDPAAPHPELWCERCEECVCDVEPGDTLAVLSGLAVDHRIFAHGDTPS